MNESIGPQAQRHQAYFERRQSLLAEKESGVTLAELAGRHGIHVARVSQILRQARAERDTDAAQEIARRLHRKRRRKEDMNENQSDFTVRDQPYRVTLSESGSDITEVLPTPESMADWRDRPKPQRAHLTWHDDSSQWMLTWMDGNRNQRAAVVDTLPAAALRFDRWLRQAREPEEYRAEVERGLRLQMEMLEGMAL